MPRGRASGSAPSSRRPRPSRSRSIARAMAPSPVCDVLRNWRRVCARACCNFQGRSEVHGESAFGQDAVEVQEHVGDRGPGGQLGRVHARRKRPERVGGQGQGGLVVLAVSFVLGRVER